MVRWRILGLLLVAATVFAACSLVAPFEDFRIAPTGELADAGPKPSFAEGGIPNLDGGEPVPDATAPGSWCIAHGAGTQLCRDFDNDTEPSGWNGGESTDPGNTVAITPDGEEGNGLLSQVDASSDNGAAFVVFNSSTSTAKVSVAFSVRQATDDSQCADGGSLAFLSGGSALVFLKVENDGNYSGQYCSTATEDGSCNSDEPVIPADSTWHRVTLSLSPSAAVVQIDQATTTLATSTDGMAGDDVPFAVGIGMIGMSGGCAWFYDDVVVDTR